MIENLCRVIYKELKVCYNASGTQYIACAFALNEKKGGIYLCRVILFILLLVNHRLWKM